MKKYDLWFFGVLVVITMGGLLGYSIATDLRDQLNAQQEQLNRIETLAAVGDAAFNKELHRIALDCGDKTPAISIDFDLTITKYRCE